MINGLLIFLKKSNILVKTLSRNTSFVPRNRNHCMNLMTQMHSHQVQMFEQVIAWMSDIIKHKKKSS